jgi:DNA-directed RNA polymerase subunit beta'
MGHIELAVPVSHIWYLRGVPSRMATLLGMSATDLEKVVYFAGYIVSKVFPTEQKEVILELEREFKTRSNAAKSEEEKDRLKALFTKTKQEIDSIVVGKVLDEMEYHRFSVKYGNIFEARIGAEAIYDIMKGLDINTLKTELEERLKKVGAAESEKISRRLALIRGMLRAKVHPSWMFLTNVPVIPPALRPMVALDGGRHATSDVNDLYRRVINRNNRLKKLMDIHAPEVILRNEKRILQEAVDALIDNSLRRSSSPAGALTASQRRPLKSLTDYLKGKHGYLRHNLLGKRVDYSGRSVIVVGPHLDLDECGLPKHMALELFRPFVISELIKRELAFNIRGAGRLIEDQVPEVWEILEKVIQGKYVLLNRAPTLHRQGMQAFRPTLIEGSAIQLHPLVCPAFNADFDGDTMSVHLPLGDEAQYEAKTIIASPKNVLKPGSGTPVLSVSHDISLGVYWMTKMVPGAKGEGKAYPSPNASILAYDFGELDFRSKITVLPTEGKQKYTSFNGGRFETTVGRLLFNSVFPEDYAFINEEVTKKRLGGIIDNLIERYGLEQTGYIMDKIKHFGFTYATQGGMTWSLSDTRVPAKKQEIIDASLQKVKEINANWSEGLLTESERIRMATEIWHKTKEDIEALLPETLDPQGSVSDIIRSGARGTMSNLSQMAGMKGLIANPKGEVIEFPVISSMSEGLSPLEYFMSTHGSRKGLADTALNTARAGYLTRRLFDVAQDVIVTEEDCKTKRTISIGRKSASGVVIDFARAIFGRHLGEDIALSNGETIPKGSLLSIDDARKIAELSTSETVSVRSPMSCETGHGICQKCYGIDLSTLNLIDVGEAIGTVAAQAIGEPGTQLTMRTFHAGGTATVGGDITQGLPRVEEIFDRRKPKVPAVVSSTDGTVIEVIEDGREKKIIVLPEGPHAPKGKDRLEYAVAYSRVPLVKEGTRVSRGQLLTDGSADLSELFEYAGEAATQEYIIHETSKIYELQGVSISRKHIEVIVKQMFSRLKILDAAGSTDFSRGDMISRRDYEEVSRMLKESGAEPIKVEPLILGITEVALSRSSFLSAASFQYTTKVLINASLRGVVDTLRGLKENVIIGRLIPAGTGFRGSKKHAMIDALVKERAQRFAALETTAGEGVLGP